MAANLTRTAFVEDCMSLLLASDQICEPFKEAVLEFDAFMQFGALRSRDDDFAFPLLDRYRLDWESHKPVKEETGFRSAPLVPKSQAESILALVLGWLCHRAADNLLTADSPEAALYQDAVLFRSLYMTTESTIERAALSELFEVLRQRFFIEMHTFIPDGEDIEGWFDKLYLNMQEWNDYMDRLAETVANPDMEKERRYVTETSFYNENDAIVSLARRLRNGEPASPNQIEEAIAAAPESHYAQALQLAFRSLHNASAFFSSRIDIAAFESFI
jgi:hypothetical protein